LSLLCASSPMLLLARLLLERGQAAEWNSSAIASVTLLAVATAAAYPVYFWLLQQFEAYQLATLQWVQPLVAMAETAAFLRLRLSLSMIAGTVMALVCLWVVMRARPEDDDSVSLLGN
jgi:drug/metabolite transporter (DMT)-like permease